MTPAPAPARPDNPAQRAVKAGAVWLRQEWQGWTNTEGGRWIFVFKCMVAAFTALWLAFRLGLDSPNTAMTTTFILALPSSGMVLEKAFYRLLGTVVGVTATVTIVALFPQQIPLMFVALALWVGLCTCGAAMYRNQQSYSFVLAGYTTVLVGLPALDHPTVIFTLAVTRLTEVGLGIIVASVVHDVLLPRHSNRQVMNTVQARYQRFITFCSEVLEERLSPAEVELTHLRFAADIAALESGRAAAFFEAAHTRWHTRQLHAFNNAFMTALTTFYTLHRLTHRLHGAGSAASPVIALIEPLHAMLAAALRADLKAGQPSPDWQRVQAELAQGVAAARTALGTVERPVQIDFDTAVELLQRFARDMTAFVALYHGLAQQRKMQVSDPVAYSPKTPTGLVLTSGLRAAVALLLGAVIWYWLEWPYLATSLAMTAVFSALASSSPRPLALIKGVMAGFVLGAPLALFTEYCLVIHATDYPLLVLAALPIFGLGCYLIADPKRGGMGIGLSLFAAQVVAPVNQIHYDPQTFLSAELSLNLGVMLAWAVFAIVLPEHTMGHKGQVTSALWREALGAARSPLFRLKLRFDNRVRDMLNQLNATAGPVPGEETRAVVRQGLTLLELGHSVIEMRQLIAASGPSPVRNALTLCVDRLTDYFRDHSRDKGEAVLDAILRAGPHVRNALAEETSEPRRQRLQTALTDLHSIYTSLLDQLPANPQGEPDHAP